ncbi:MAG: hypothetical protein ACYCOU_15760 [Sulfobacillus sp.]
MEVTPELVSWLYDRTDPEFRERNSLSELESKYPNRAQLVGMLMRRNCDGLLRCLVRPVGETYAPVCYDRDCFLRLGHKRWGQVLTLTFWDLLVIDVDQVQDIAEIDRTLLAFPNELFYVHRTPRGYHVYLMSRPVLYCSSEAIRLRLALGCDPKYAAFSLYHGSAVRLTRKASDTERPSIKVAERGAGSPDPDCLRIYHKITGFLETFQDFDGASLLKDAGELIWNLWKNQLLSHDDFGLVHVAITAPEMLYRPEDVPGAPVELNQLVSEETPRHWPDFCRRPFIRPERLPDLLAGAYQLKQYKNLYRIFEANADHAVGSHIEENVLFISYRDLLMVDYDRADRLGVVATYCRYHPDAVFRTVKTHRGHHLFLTSRPVPHNSPEAADLLMRLCSDPAHALSCLLRGYSVRLNRKHAQEREYREVRKFGRGEEDPRLVALYEKHLKLYRLFADAEPVYCMRKNALEEFRSAYDL